MSKLVADLGDGRATLVARGDLPREQLMVSSDLRKEWELLCALGEQPVRVAPRAYHADLTGDELGRRTMLTEFVEGASLQMSVLTTPPETHDALLDEFAALAARIHSVALDALPPAFEVPSSWDDYIDRRLAGWREAEARWVERTPVMRYVGAWLAANRPVPMDLTLVHGDFHTSNVMVLPEGDQMAVDWELAHVGDPREDLGWTMIYEVAAPPPLVTRGQERFCETYRAHAGCGEDLVNPATIGWFALLNIASGVDAITPAFEAIIDGTSTSLTAAMCAVMGVTLGGHCLETIAALEGNA
ncbi:phosphotransferase family protein [Nocardia asteroides]|uniref:phosphotransferase family protein n=1 Tax=Nocardia asteroides TaxID=1824 RepID=UPI001E35BCF0|nr:phosphotransferase family protein [Nocardia asteroides]UGT55092.1 phosphotransferase family protein [Nocardia asteroides]